MAHGSLHPWLGSDFSSSRRGAHNARPLSIFLSRRWSCRFRGTVVNVVVCGRVAWSFRSFSPIRRRQRGSLFSKAVGIRRAPPFLVSTRFFFCSFVVFVDTRPYGLCLLQRSVGVGGRRHSPLVAIVSTTTTTARRTPLSVLRPVRRWRHADQNFDVEVQVIRPPA